MRILLWSLRDGGLDIKRLLSFILSVHTRNLHKISYSRHTTTCQIDLTRGTQSSVSRTWRVWVHVIPCWSCWDPLSIWKQMQTTNEKLLLQKSSIPSLATGGKMKFDHWTQICEFKDVAWLLHDFCEVLQVKNTQSAANGSQIERWLQKDKLSPKDFNVKENKNEKIVSNCSNCLAANENWSHISGTYLSIQNACISKPS